MAHQQDQGAGCRHKDRQENDPWALPADKGAALGGRHLREGGDHEAGDHQEGRDPACGDQQRGQRALAFRDAGLEGKPGAARTGLDFRLRRQQRPRNRQQHHHSDHRVDDHPAIIRGQKQGEEAGNEAGDPVTELVERRHQVLVFFGPRNFDAPGVQDDVMRCRKERGKKGDNRNQADILAGVRECEKEKEASDRQLQAEQPGAPGPEERKRMMRGLESR